MNQRYHRLVCDICHAGPMALSAAALCLCLVWPLWPQWVHSQTLPTRIGADPSAPLTRQPTVLTTGNGLALVNIQTPSAAGVSRNTYSQFDVGSTGAILNNSRSNVQTQLGGWVQGNPWLATGSARVILSEVNASRPSQLQGYVEVAGQRAEVVIANPAGIAVAGGGFINASGVTLTTGTPVVNNGALTAYRVQGGSVSIDGQGLDTRSADYTAILGRAVQLNAGIWAQRLQMVTGANEIASGTLGSTATPQVTPLAGTGARPTFALDTSHLGGMYAGQITLVGTEAGLGVRNAGQWLAGAGSLVLNQDGWLSNSGTLQATGGDVQVQVRGDLDQSGTVSSSQQVLLRSGGHQNHAGTVAAQGGVRIEAAGPGARIQASERAVWAAGLQADGQLTGQQDLSVQAAGAIELRGLAVASGNLSLAGAALDLSRSSQQAQTVRLNATEGDLLATGSQVLASGELQLHTPKSLVTDGARLQAGAIALQAGDWRNRAGQLVQTGAADQVIALTGNLDNTAGLIQSAARRWHLSATNVDNSAGQLLHTGDTSFTLSVREGLRNLTDAPAQAALPEGARIVSAGDLRVEAQDISTSGTIAATGDVAIGAGAFSGSSTHVVAAGLAADGSVSGKGALTVSAERALQSQGRALAGGQVKLSGASLDLSDGVVSSTGGDVDLRATRGDIVTRQARIQAQEGLTLTASGADQRADNSQGRLSAKVVNVQAAGLVNTGGAIVATQGASLSVARLENDSGLIASQGDLTLRLQGDHTLAGVLQAGGDMRIEATGRLSNPVSVQAGKNLRLTAQSLDNQEGGEWLSGQVTHLGIAQTLTNRGLVDGADTRIEATTVNNLGTGRIYGDRVAIAANTLNNQEEARAGVTRAATIAGRERVDLGVGSFINREGSLVYSGGDMAIGGAIDASGRATGAAQTVHNASATLEAAQALRIAADSVRNTNEHFASELRPVSQGPVTEFQHGAGDVFRVSDTSTRFPASAVSITDCESRCMTSSAGTSDAFVRYDMTRSVQQSVVTQSTPGKILAGTDLTLLADTVLNDKSQIVAGGILDARGARLSNIDGEGVRLTSDVGTATSFWRQRRSGRDTYSSSATPYAPAQVSETVALQVSRYETHTPAPETAAPPGDLVDRGAQTVTRREFSVAGVAAAARALASTTPEPSVAAGSGAPPPTGALPVTFRLPNSSLFQIHPESGARFLVETDPRFTQYRTWLGSDYLLRALNIDPAATLRRLGDGFYEQRLMRDQVQALTGQRYLGNFTNDQQQYQALMDAGLTYARQWNLRPGIALSAEQVAQLTSDMVWLETQSVTLPDGSKQDVLVPRVYVQVRPGDLDGSGALLAGRDVNIRLSGDAINSGTIAGRNLVRINADNIRNLGGQVSADSLALQAVQDIDNTGGRLQAQSAAALLAGRNITFATTTSNTSSQAGGNAFTRTGVDRVAGLYVTGPAGVLVARAVQDLRLTAAQINNAGTGPTVLQAGNDLILDTVTARSSQALRWDSKNHLNQSASQDVGTQISTGGALSILAGRNLRAQAADVKSASDLTVQAAGQVDITAGQATQSLDAASEHTSRGVFSDRTLATQEQSSRSTAVGSNLEGQRVRIEAGQDLRVHGSSVLADGDVTLRAAGDLRVEAAQSTSSQSSLRRDSQSGLFTGDGVSLTLGTREQTVTVQSQNTTAAASTVGSLGGNVTLTGGKAYTQTGSDVLAPKGDVTIAAQTVTIEEARESASGQSEQAFRQSGVTLALTSPVISTVQMVQQQAQAAGNTQSSRMQALAAANAAMQVAQGAAQTQAALARGDTTGGLGISLSIGRSSSQSDSQWTASSGRGSTVTAGGNVTIAATGAGQASNVTVQGSDIKAVGVATVIADNQVTLRASEASTQESNSQRSQSASVGITMGVGPRGAEAGVTASASGSRGDGAGAGTSYRNTHLEGGQQVVIESGGDTRLQGATVAGGQVTARVGGDLTIESLQDTDRYHERSQSASVSVTGGPASGGSLSLGRTRIDSDFTSVGEQSAIRAGDGGFAVDVKGRTTLIGGQITSTERAVQDGANRYASAGGTVTQDLQNSARFSADTLSVGLGAGAPAPGASLSAGLSGVGVGSDGASASSTSRAGITGVAGDTTARTGDKSTSLQSIFNKDEVKKEVTAQATITQEFGRQASRVVGDYADAQLRQAQAAGDTAGVDAWREGGAARVALHAVVGGLTQGVGGAVGAGASQLVIDQIGQTLKDTNLPGEIKQALLLVAGTAVGAATGGTAGAATAFNATANNYLTHTDLRSKEQQLAACTDANCRRQVTAHWDRVSQERNARAGDSIAAGSEASTIKVMAVLSADMSNLAQYRAGLEDQLRSTTDPTQRANLQLQVNEADNNMRQIASQGKDALALLYQQTGDPRYQNAFQALMVATSGSEIGAALAMPSGGGGNLNRGVQEGRPASNAAAQGVENVGAGAGAGRNVGAAAVETATPVTSGGTASVVTAPRLREQLTAENLANIAAQDARLALAVNGSGGPNPNFSVGSGTAAEALSLGRIWVGDGARPLGGVPGGLISADGTRVFRPPTPKPNAPAEFNPTGIQANFQVRDSNTGAVTSNGHMVIK